MDKKHVMKQHIEPLNKVDEINVFLGGVLI